METPERHAVREALNDLKPHLSAYVERYLNAARATAPTVLAPRPYAATPDVATLIKLMIDNWDAVFATHLPRFVRTYLHELRDVRNRWAHEEGFTSDEAARVIDTVRRVGTAIGAGLTVGNRPSEAAAIDNTPEVAAAGSVVVSHPSILFRITKSYRPGMPAAALYEAVRGVWKLSERRNGARYAMAVYGGKVVEVFVVDRWQRAGSSEYSSRDLSSVDFEDRWEFVGSVAPATIRNKYIGADVGSYFPAGGRNPVAYAGY
jgi:hypothetical protein